MFISSMLKEALDTFFSSHHAKIVMLGLDGAGKTTVLYKLKLNETVSTIPTIGFNVETVKPTKHLSFTVWDVGGQEVLRPLWRHYFQGCSGLIYIVDSSDNARIASAKEELDWILSECMHDSNYAYTYVHVHQSILPCIAMYICIKWLMCVDFIGLITMLPYVVICLLF